MLSLNTVRHSFAGNYVVSVQALHNEMMDVVCKMLKNRLSHFLLSDSLHYK